MIEFFMRFGSKLIASHVFSDYGEVAGGVNGIGGEGSRRVVHGNQSKVARNGRAYCLQQLFSQAGVLDSSSRWVKGLAGEIAASCNNVCE